MPTTTNILKCWYCDWKTLCFRGKKCGEYQLRAHVIECHFAEYQAAMGLIAMDDDTPWTMDHGTRGEQAL